MYSVPSTFQLTTTWTNTTSYCCSLRKIRNFLPQVGFIVISIVPIRATGKANLINRFPSTVLVNHVTNHQLPRWTIRHCRTSFCRNRCATISNQMEMLSNFGESIGRCCWSSHAHSTKARIAIRALGDKLGCVTAPVKSLWNTLYRWPSIFDRHSTFCSEDIWISSSIQRRKTSFPPPLQEIIILVGSVGTKSPGNGANFCSRV